MTIFSSLKTLPLIAILAAGIGLAPSLASAGTHNAESHKSQRTQHKTKNNRHGYQNNNRHAQTNHRNRHAMHSGQKQRINKHNKSRHVVHNRHYRGNNHAHNRYCRHPISYLSNVQQPYFLSRNGLRLMLGLHTDNIDFVFHD